MEDVNKMSPSNLGIVFGPSLMRPRPSGATVSLSSLVDYPYQARIVETLIALTDEPAEADKREPHDPEEECLISALQTPNPSEEPLKSSISEPPALPETEPPELEEPSESMAALNISQSNSAETLPP
ncbi:hypothetical protein DNTS_026422 [Danionella cerebrum]|uniref:Rho-GAP domain-containing protein n=1 Tax=Danionella cerebrum TaxID=2873325 RepID=A0A553RKV5_9TELE|nr:hypothetical protein DNTS_026422 [Danionella translucida]